MFYSAPIQDAAREMRSQFPALSWEEPVYLLSGSETEFYLFDDGCLRSERFPVLLRLLRLLAGGSQRRLGFLSGQLPLLPAPDALKRDFAGHLCLFQSEKLSTPCALWRIVSRNPSCRFTVLLTADGPLARRLNALRFLNGRPVTVLCFSGQRFLGRCGCLPALPPVDLSRPALPAKQQPEPPEPPFHLESGLPLNLSEPAGSGGEANCYLTADGKSVCKIFYGLLAPGSPGEQKLQALCRLGRRAASPGLCLPIEPVLDGQNRVCGYRMNRCSGVRLGDLFRSPETYAQWFGSRLETAELAVDLICNLLRLIYNGILPMDLKPDNILIRKTPSGPKSTLIDLDSAQFHRYSSPTCSPEILAPWMQQEQSACAELLRDPADLSFALYVLCFQLLVNGLHPYSGGRIPESEFVFARRHPETAALLEPYYNVFSYLSPRLQNSFRMVFSNQNPALQPDPRVLLELLLDFASDLRAGPPEANQLWPAHPRPSARTRSCSCCRKVYPANFLIRYSAAAPGQTPRELILCKSCRSALLPQSCPACGESLGLTVEALLLAGRGQGSVPLYCPVCTAIKAETEPDQPLTRGITPEEEQQILCLAGASPRQNQRRPGRFPAQTKHLWRSIRRSAR